MSNFKFHIGVFCGKHDGKVELLTNDKAVIKLEKPVSLTITVLRLLTCETEAEVFLVEIKDGENTKVYTDFFKPVTKWGLQNILKTISNEINDPQKSYNEMMSLKYENQALRGQVERLDEIVRGVNPMNL